MYLRQPALKQLTLLHRMRLRWVAHSSVYNQRVCNVHCLAHRTLGAMQQLTCLRRLSLTRCRTGDNDPSEVLSHMQGLADLIPGEMRHLHSTFTTSRAQPRSRWPDSAGTCQTGYAAVCRATCVVCCASHFCRAPVCGLPGWEGPPFACRPVMSSVGGQWQTNLLRMICSLLSRISILSKALYCCRWSYRRSC